MAYTDTITANLDATLAELGRRVDFVQKIDEADTCLSGLDAQLNEAIARAGDVSQLRSWGEMEAFMATTDAEMQALLKKALEIKRQWKLLVRIRRILLQQHLNVDETQRSTDE